MYNQKYLYLCGMKTKTTSVMKTVNKNEVVPLLAVIATGVASAGILIGGETLAIVGVAMYLIPIYIAIVDF